MSDLFGGGSKVREVPEPTEEEVQKKALARERKIQRSRERFLERQAALGAVQLSAPGLFV